MASKYQLVSNLSYYKDSDVPKKIFEELKQENYLKDFEHKPKEEFAMIVAYNGYKFIDYSSVTPEEYINVAIECVQFVECSGFEKIILDGLNK